MFTLKAVSLTLLAAASTALAQTDKFCTSATKVCTAVNIPESGDEMYFQITAPTSVGWAGVGIGQQMAGSLIFMVYPSSKKGEVMVSPRIGRGNVMPEYTEDIQIEMLSGSGIVGDNFVANFMCSNCKEWENGEVDITSDDQSFIWAVGGSADAAPQAAELDANVNKHSTKGTFSLDLSKATGGDGGNPFANATVGPEPEGDDGEEDKDEDKTGLAPITRADKILFAHGVVMGVVWVLLFPLGAAFIRLLNNRIPNAVYLHAGLQITNFVLVCVGLGLGVWRSHISMNHWAYFHQYFGVIIVALLLVQIMLGVMHHKGYMRYKKRTFWSYGHIWTGRILILAAMVNGGLGLDLAQARTVWIIVYSAVVGAVFLVYVVSYGIKSRRRQPNLKW